MMKIKITKCSDPTYWYASNVGDEYEVIRAVKYLDNDGGRFGK